jgi:hypothetical protein
VAFEAVLLVELHLFLEQFNLILESGDVSLMLVSGALGGFPILFLLNFHAFLLGEFALLLALLVLLLLDGLELGGVIDEVFVVGRVAVGGRVALLLAHVD